MNIQVPPEVVPKSAVTGNPNDPNAIQTWHGLGARTCPLEFTLAVAGLFLTAFSNSLPANYLASWEGTETIDAFMDDKGAHNAAVGHRRRLLFPALSEVKKGRRNTGPA